MIGPVIRGGLNADYPGQSTGSVTVYLANAVGPPTSTGDWEIYVEVNVETGQNMNGTWTVTFIPVALGPASGEVDLWRYAATGGVTASFVTGNSPQELVSEPGNSEELITVAVSKHDWTACNGTSTTFSATPPVGNLASFSSPGPTRDGRQKPEIAAPGVAIGSATTFDIAQSCPAAPNPSVLLPDGLNHQMMAGTSMAAAHVAGAAALLLQKRGPMTPAQIKSYLASHATVDAFVGTVWNQDWGNGKANLGDLVDPVARVVSPNGGETLTAGSNTIPRWNATDALGSVTAVDLQISRAILATDRVP